MDNVWFVTNKLAKLKLLQYSAGIHPVRSSTQGCLDFKVHFAYADESNVRNYLTGIAPTHLFIDEDCDNFTKDFLHSRVRVWLAGSADIYGRRYCEMNFDMMQMAAQMFRGKLE